MKPDAPTEKIDRTEHYRRLVEWARGSRAAEVWFEFKTGRPPTTERPSTGQSEIPNPTAVDGTTQRDDRSTGFH